MTCYWLGTLLCIGIELISHFFYLSLVASSDVSVYQQILQNNVRSEFSQCIATNTIRLLSAKNVLKSDLSPLEKLENFKCLEFDSLAEEELFVAQSIKDKLSVCKPADIAVACPTISDVARMELICEEMNLPIIRNTFRNSENGYLLLQVATIYSCRVF